MKQKPYFRAAVKENVLELAIYEEIGEDMWSGGGITAKGVKKEIDAAGEFGSVTVRINSPGGDVFEGLAIHNLLRSLGKPINVCVDGVAASIASVIAMAGDTIEIAKNAMMMVHNAWGVSMGNANDMRQMADTLDKVTASIAQTYVDRSGKSAAVVKALLDAETWMSADDCIKEGFATSIAANRPKAFAMATRFKALARMKNLPEVLKAGMGECDCSCAACQSGDCEECSNAECNDPNCYDCPMQTSAKNAKTEVKIHFVEGAPEGGFKTFTPVLENTESIETDDSEVLRLQLQMIKARAA